MARPHKRTVEYFSHDTDASDGKTLTIIQSKYGNDGYAFWFKLLQLLGRTPGHYFNFNKPAEWEFLLAKTHQDDAEKAHDILKTLVVLGAIDEELYARGVIWCQKFADRVAPAYSRTVGGVPKRPDFLVNVGDKDVSVPNNRVSVDNNPEKATLTPQRKGKERKRKRKESSSSKDQERTTAEDIDLSEENAEVAILYEAEIGKITPFAAQELNDAMQNYPPAWIKDAIKEAVNQNKRTWKYVLGILKHWKESSRQTEGAAADDLDRYSKQKHRHLIRGGKDDPDKFIKGKYGHMVQR